MPPAVPGDPLQFEKADIEPIGQELAQIFGEAGKRPVVTLGDELGAAVDQKLDPLGQR